MVGADGAAPLNFPAPIEVVRARADRIGRELLERIREPLNSTHPELSITSEVTEVGAAERHTKRAGTDGTVRATETADNFCVKGPIHILARTFLYG